MYFLKQQCAEGAQVNTALHSGSGTYSVSLLLSEWVCATHYPHSVWFPWVWPRTGLWLRRPLPFTSPSPNAAPSPRDFSTPVPRQLSVSSLWPQWLRKRTHSCGVRTDGYSHDSDMSKFNDLNTNAFTWLFSNLVAGFRQQKYSEGMWWSGVRGDTSVMECGRVARRHSLSRLLGFTWLWHRLHM